MGIFAAEQLWQAGSKDRTDDNKIECRNCARASTLSERSPGFSEDTNRVGERTERNQRVGLPERMKQDRLRVRCGAFS
jgi:hypothetical protein